MKIFGLAAILCAVAQQARSVTLYSESSHFLSTITDPKSIEDVRAESARVKEECSNEEPRRLVCADGKCEQYTCGNNIPAVDPEVAASRRGEKYNRGLDAIAREAMGTLDDTQEKLNDQEAMERIIRIEQANLEAEIELRSGQAKDGIEYAESLEGDIEEAKTKLEEAELQARQKHQEIKDTDFDQVLEDTEKQMPQDSTEAMMNAIDIEADKRQKQQEVSEDSARVLEDAIDIEANRRESQNAMSEDSARVLERSIAFESNRREAQQSMSGDSAVILETGIALTDNKTEAQALITDESATAFDNATTQKAEMDRKIKEFVVKMQKE